MIGVVPLAAGLLATFSDGEETDVEELFQRAVLMKNPDIVFDAMTPEEITEFFVKLKEWFDHEVKNTPNLTQWRYQDLEQVFLMFFRSAPMFTVFRATGQKKLKAHLDGTITDRFVMNDPFDDSNWFKLNDYFKPDVRTQKFLDEQEGAIHLMGTQIEMRRDHEDSPGYPINVGDAIFQATTHGFTILKTLTGFVVVKEICGRDVLPVWSKDAAVPEKKTSGGRSSSWPWKKK